MLTKVQSDTDLARYMTFISVIYIDYICHSFIFLKSNTKKKKNTLR
jgi:hypothetical protein